ncbi:hypothetical protein QBC38DRAFT_461181 [Podospora fimiseda]|uniref:Fungal N-terminal domain-containing protein n=1 Tax=Podospora fimiseda TaxID=252190 RepID=A0AAN6YSG7_9PEZI|nr:hypothetical protein QBC38DRAFT_461181 [Podospora fimiseda]
MDPLSITSAVIFSLLDALSSIKDSPSTIKDAKNELRHTELGMKALQRLFNRLESDTASSRREMIQIEDLRIILADAMLNFSEFETLLELLNRLASYRVAIWWSKYSKQLEEHLAKLQRQKLSFTLMLSILQCDTVDEAYRSQERLHDLLEKVLDENAELKEKLLGSKDMFDALSIATRRQIDDSATIRHDASTIRGPVLREPSSFEHSTGAIKFAFENILEDSRVYRRTRVNEECDRSFATSVARSRG